MSALDAMGDLISRFTRSRAVNRLKHYVPYPKQMEFHNVKGKGTDKPATQKLLLGGNQGGKTYCGASEMAIHLTGLYPDWWEGTRYNFPIAAMCGSNTNETGRDIIQKELCGDPLDETQLGTGTIPLNCIGKTTRKAGVLNAYDAITVKHHTNGVFDGMSKVYIRAYEQGAKKFMGIRFHVGWLDEEPPQDIWSQFLRAGLAQKDAMLYMTLTPEEGMTTLVTQFLNELKYGQSVTQFTWDDALHFTEEDKVRKLEAFPEHEREMRRNGSPLQGAGLIFSIPDEDIKVEPFDIPRHWTQINGVDFGWDHPFGASRIAYDRDNDVVYITACYRERKVIPAVHGVHINAWGNWIPVAWPHDGLNTEKGTGDELRKSYVDVGVNFLPWKSTNPPQMGQKEGEGGNSVEASILEMVERMTTGRLKVFSTCKEWFEEKRMYHRDMKGKVVKVADDVLSSSRYAIMMLRHARVEVIHRKVVKTRKGRTNWGSK